MRKETSKFRFRLALALAASADFLQIVLFPFFGEGLISPLDTGLDLMVCAAVTALLGWHWAFLPTFFIEAFPVADMVPTWTIAVLLSSRKPAPEIVA